MTSASIGLRSIENPYPRLSIMRAELAIAECEISPIWRFGRLRLADHLTQNGGFAH